MYSDCWESMNDQISRLLEQVRELETEKENLRAVNADLRAGWDKCLEAKVEMEWHVNCSHCRRHYNVTDLEPDYIGAMERKCPNCGSYLFRIHSFTEEEKKEVSSK